MNISVPIIAALFFGGLSWLFWWKKVAKKPTSILAGLSGFCASGTILLAIGGFSRFNTSTKYMIGGGLIIVFIWFVLEMRDYGHHHARTPILGFILGAFAIAGLSLALQFLHSLGTTSNTQLTQTTSNSAGR